MYRRFWVAYPLGYALLLGGCGGNVTAPPVAKIAATNSNESSDMSARIHPSAIGRSVVVSAPQDGDTVVRVDVPTGSQCFLDGDRKRPLVVNAFSRIELHLAPSGNTPIDSTIALDCVQKNNVVLRTPIALHKLPRASVGDESTPDSATAPQRPTVAQLDAARRTFVDRYGFEPQSASVAALSNKNVPSRPDATSDAYADWLIAVTSPEGQIVTQGVAGPPKHLTLDTIPPNTPVQLNTVKVGNWAGMVQGYPNHTVGLASAKISVPRIFPNQSVPYDDIAFWVGIDNGPSIEQTGIDESVLSANNGTNVAQYSLWYEFFPASPTYYTASINPGDVIWCETWISGATQYPKASFWCKDLTNGAVHQANAVGNPGAIVNGSVVEWIAERRAIAPNTYSGVPRWYHHANMSGMQFAKAPGMPWTNATTVPYALYLMYDTWLAPQTEVVSSQVYPNGIDWHWFREF